MLEAPRAMHQLGGPGDEGAERAAEALRETDRDGVGMTRDLRGWDAERNRGIEEARAVEVQPQAELAAGVGDRRDLLQRPDAPAGAVVRVLDRDDPRDRRMPIVPQSGGGTDLLRREAATVAPERTGEEAAERGGSAELGDQNVGVLLCEHLVTGLAVQPERDLVRHRRRGHVDRFFLPEQRRRALLEQ